MPVVENSQNFRSVYSEKRGKNAEDLDCLFTRTTLIPCSYVCRRNGGLNCRGYFVCEFLLWRRNIDAYRKDWPFMLALDATPFVVVFIMVLVEKRAVILEQGPGILLSACGGTYAGAVVASITAKRMAARP